MKILFLLSLVLLFVISPVYGQLLSDATGLVNRLNIQTGGYTFEIETVSNFNIHDYDFEKNEHRLSLFINSGLENNLGEILIPQRFLGGNLTFYLNDQQYFPKINSNEKISFITLNFTGSGENKLEIIGTTHLNGLTDKEEIPQKELSPPPKEEMSFDSIIWLGLVVLLAIGVTLIIIKIKKQK